MSDTGWKSPGTVVDDSSVGTVAWSNPENAKASDNSYATATNTSSLEKSHYLKATSFGFSIPTDATINGIMVRVERKSNNEYLGDGHIQLVKGGIISSAEDKAHGLSWNTESYIEYGSSSDLWSETWTYSDINSSTFGFALTLSFAADTGDTGSVDHIQIKVYYTDNSTPVVGQKYALPPFRRS